MAPVDIVRKLVSHFRDPVTKVPDWEVTAKGVLAWGDHALYRFRDDFDAYRASAAGTVGWHLDESGTSTAAAMTTDPFGVVTAKPGATGGNNFHYQWALNTTVLTPATLAANKKAALFVRFKVEDADQNLPRVGLIVPTDDPWNAEETDQFQFRTNSGDPDALEFAFGKTAASEVTIALGNLEDNTFVRCLAYYDGYDTVHAFRFDDSGNLVTSGRASCTSATRGDLLPDAALTFAWGMENVDTGADDFHIDVLDFCMER